MRKNSDIQCRIKNAEKGEHDQAIRNLLLITVRTISCILTVMQFSKHSSQRKSACLRHHSFVPVACLSSVYYKLMKVLATLYNDLASCSTLKTLVVRT